VAEGVAIDGAPVASDEGIDEQKECRLRLMEVGDEGINYFVVVAGGDDYLRGGVERVGVLVVVPTKQSLEGFAHGERRRGLVGFPLSYMK